jgi:hypothetical protein
MRRLLFIFSLIVASLTLTSCIELVEEISINNDLSGSYELKIETSGFGNMLTQLGGLTDMPQINDIDFKTALLSKQKGISNVKKNISPKDLKFNISFDFENENALNNAIYAMAEVKPNFILKKFLKVRKSKIVRPNLSPYIVKLINDQNLVSQIPTEDMLSFLNYKFKLNTPKVIKKTSGSNAVISQEGQSVATIYSFKEILIENKSVYLKVKM